MPRIQVLLDQKGKVLGTAEAQDAVGQGAPVARLVPRDDQTVVEVSVSDAEARLDATSLLKTLKSKSLRTG
ncbi:MAG: hypothetical protein QM655_08840 [Nocardioidaceae bacterium]